MQKTLKSHGTWIGKWTFVLAATGSAVGLGNIWGFPYKAGTEGGGAFVLIYLLCIVLIGLPIMLSEILIGRRSGNSPINSMKKSAIDSDVSSAWQGVGWIGISAGILILSFYSVIAGICLKYIFVSASSNDLDTAGQFLSIVNSPKELMLWHTIFMGLTMFIVSAGVKKGIGRMVKILMPMLGLLLIFMVVYGIINGAFTEALSFLFKPDFTKITSDTFLVAMGQAFFSLSLGMGSIMAYGAYMSKDQNIASTSVSVGALDTLVAIMAGLAVFPIIFAIQGLEASGGPGLVFISLQTAFNTMDFGNIIGPIFFILLSVAALSSSISILEPGVAYLAEEGYLSRTKSAIIISITCWLIGIGTAFGFDQDGNNLFQANVELISVNIMQPLGGMLIAIFIGWFMKESLIKDELGDINQAIYQIWRIFIKFVAPIGVGIVLISQLF
ncbi:sodium-dependent transporter [Gammaproteobacteria bacterium]|nr:sodium-dependent transporter [Gammaproteobacteria bacterium]